MWESFKMWWEKSIRKIIASFIVLCLVSLIIVSIVAMFSECTVCFFIELLGHKNGEKRGVLEFLGLVISGLIAIYGLVTIDRRLTMQEEVNKLQGRTFSQDKFNVALEHLKDDQESVRIFSFNEFFEVVKIDKKNYGQAVADRLCKYLREKTEGHFDLYDPDLNPTQKTPSLEDIHPAEVIILVSMLFGNEAKRIFDGVSYDLRGANLTLFNIKLNKARKEIDFRNATLESAVFDGGNLSGCKFREANLQATKFQGTVLNGADFSSAELFFTLFNGVDLIKARFKKSKMSDTYFTNKSNLKETKFTNVDLCAANLKETKNLQKSIFSSAKYNDYTKFPEEFDPQSHKGLEYIPPKDENK